MPIYRGIMNRIEYSIRSHDTKIIAYDGIENPYYVLEPIDPIEIRFIIPYGIKIEFPLDQGIRLRSDSKPKIFLGPLE